MSIQTNSVGALRVAAIAVGLAASTLNGRADAPFEAVSNLGNTRLGGLQLQDSLPLGASLFTTGPAQGAEQLALSGVRMSLRELASGGLTVELWSNLGDNNPTSGTLLSTLNIQGSLPANYASVTYLDPLQTLLSPNTSYWLVATVGAGAVVDWAETSDPSETGARVPGWSIADEHRYFNNNTSTLVTSSLALQYAVDVVAVPEASTIAAGLVLLGGVGGMVWRRRNAG